MRRPFQPSEIQKARLRTIYFRTMLHQIFRTHLMHNHYLVADCFCSSTESGALISRTTIRCTGFASVLSDMIYEASGVRIQDELFYGIRSSRDLRDHLIQRIMRGITGKEEIICMPPRGFRIGD